MIQGVRGEGQCCGECGCPEKCIRLQKCQLEYTDTPIEISATFTSAAPLSEECLWKERCQAAEKSLADLEAVKADLDMLGTVIRTGFVPPERDWTDDTSRKSAMRAVELHQEVLTLREYGNAATRLASPTADLEALMADGRVLVNRPTAIGQVLEKIGARLRQFYGNRFALGAPVQHTDNERQVLLIALQCLEEARTAPTLAEAIAKARKA